MYKLNRQGGVIRLADRACIPENTGNRDWQEYQEWLAAGNVPEPIETLVEAKARRVGELRASYAAALQGGFVSSGLGTPHRYMSDLSSQVKLAGGAACGATVQYECVEVATEAETVKSHTAAQMRQVLVDGKDAAVAFKLRLRDRVAQVMASTTLAQVNAVIW